jgi:hypothetical protein
MKPIKMYKKYSTAYTGQKTRESFQRTAYHIICFGTFLISKIKERNNTVHIGFKLTAKSERGQLTTSSLSLF